MRWQFSIRRRDNHALGVTLGRYTKVSEGGSAEPFASALLAAKDEAKKHASKVTVVDEIPPPSGSTILDIVCGISIKISRKSLIFISDRNELVKQFPKPDVPALHVPELDKWLVLIQGKLGKQSLANLRWEQDLQVTERNYMDAAGPLCILLQHLKRDPQAVQVGEAINLVLKSLRLLGHAVATVNKHRRQDIVKSTHITDITEHGKHSDSLQKFLFVEIKAVKALIRRGLTITTGVFGGPPPKGSLTWEGWTKGLHSNRSPTSSPRKLPTETIYRGNKGKPSSYSFTSPLPFVYVNLENIPRAGRLKYFLQNWELLTSGQWTLNTVKGYKLELTEVPRQSRLPSPHPLNASQLALVEDEIASLLDKRAIQQVPYHSNLFCSNLFLVEKKGGGQRPVINLSTLNSFVCHHHFKVEDLKVVADSLRPLDFMCKIDLRGAYFAIPIHPAHQKLLCFQFKNVTYQFKCLPFGLTSAPRVFTKVLN